MTLKAVPCEGVNGGGLGVHCQLLVAAQQAVNSADASDGDATGVRTPVLAQSKYYEGKLSTYVDGSWQQLTQCHDVCSN